MSPQYFQDFQYFPIFSADVIPVLKASIRHVSLGTTLGRVRPTIPSSLASHTGSRSVTWSLCARLEGAETGRTTTVLTRRVIQAPPARKREHHPLEPLAKRAKIARLSAAADGLAPTCRRKVILRVGTVEGGRT